MALFTCPITRVTRETPRNRLVSLTAAGTVFTFEAGQYVQLGDHGQGERKPYSVACAPARFQETGVLEFLIQVDGNESAGPHLARLAAGRLVVVEGPSGSFVLPADLRARSVLFVGGGTGIAPLRSMLWQVLERMPLVAVAVLQSARTPDELSYAGELRALAAAGRIRLVETVTRDAPDSWSGARGRIDVDQLSLVLGGPDTLCYVCGPDSLVEDVPRLLEDLGVAARNIRTERWADQAAAAAEQG